MEKMYEEILSLVEEFINELDDETVNNSAEKRRENEEKAIDKYLEAVRKNNRNYDAEEVQQAREDGRVTREKYQKNQDLRAKRDKRLEKKLADFKERLLNRKPQTTKETQKAASDHANAMIDQYYRNKLEKVFSNECFEEITSLIRESLEEVIKKNLESSPVGSKEWYKAMGQSLKANTAKTKAQLQRREEGKPMLDERPKAERKQATSDYFRRNRAVESLEDLASLIEGELINFQEKRKQKVLDRNAEKMAQMMQDGSLNAVRVLPNKELIGDPAAIKKVKDIQAENEEVIRKCRKHG